MIIFIIVCLWILLSMSIFFQSVPLERLPVGNFSIVVIIFLIFGPIFVLNNLIIAILNYFLPPGWNDDDRD